MFLSVAAMADVQQFASIVGKTTHDAQQALKKKGYSMRVSKLDGEAQMLTRDMNNHRVNVEVLNGKVVQVFFVG